MHFRGSPSRWAAPVARDDSYALILQGTEFAPHAIATPGRRYLDTIRSEIYRDKLPTIVERLGQGPEVRKNWQGKAPPARAIAF